MGFYTQYDGGNMIIPVAAFPNLREALPGLLEKYQVEDVEHVPANEQARYEKMREKAEKERDNTWLNVAENWLSLPDEIRPLLSLMRAIAADDGYHVDYGTERVDGEEIWGLKISFSEKKNWDWSLLSDVGPFLLPGTYIQVDDDNGRVRRYVAKNCDVECVLPSWG